MIKEQELQVAGRNSLACDKTRHDQVHSSSLGEPISTVDFRLYRVALQEYGGVPKEDAKKQVKELRTRYESATLSQRVGIAETMGYAFEGLLGSGVEKPELSSVIAKPQEVVIYTKDR